MTASSVPLLTPDEKAAGALLKSHLDEKAAGALLKSRLKVMGNLTTVLTLLLGMEIAQLSVIHDVEASQAGVVAIIGASVAVGFTCVGLGCAIFFQLLAATIKEGHAQMFINELPDDDWLSTFPMLAFAFSCPCIFLSLACSVCVRYDNHWSALVAAAILGVAQLACWGATVKYCKIQEKCKSDMHGQK